MTINRLPRCLENIEMQIRIAEETIELITNAVSDSTVTMIDISYAIQGVENILRAVIDDMEEAISGAMDLASKMENLVKGE